MTIKYHLKRLNGEHTHDLASADAPIPKCWGYIEAGWYTADQLLKMGLLQEGKPTKVVIDRAGFQQDLTDEEAKHYDNVLTKEIPGDIDGVIISKYIIIPEINHIEYQVEANYTIEVEDTSAQELAEATAKAQRKADLDEIKGFLQDIQGSDLKPWHKKILKFLVKEQKE